MRFILATLWYAINNWIKSQNRQINWTPRLSSVNNPQPCSLLAIVASFIVCHYKYDSQTDDVDVKLDFFFLNLRSWNISRKNFKGMLELLMKYHKDPLTGSWDIAFQSTVLLNALNISKVCYMKHTQINPNTTQFSYAYIYSVF